MLFKKSNNSMITDKYGIKEVGEFLIFTKNGNILLDTVKENKLTVVNGQVYLEIVEALYDRKLFNYFSEKNFKFKGKIVGKYLIRNRKDEEDEIVEFEYKVKSLYYYNLIKDEQHGSYETRMVFKIKKIREII